LVEKIRKNSNLQKVVFYKLYVEENLQGSKIVQGRWWGSYINRRGEDRRTKKKRSWICGEAL